MEDATEVISMDLTSAYADTLLDYCNNHGEDALYRATEISSQLIAENYGPDEIVAMHYDAIQTLTSPTTLSASDRIRILSDAHQFLLEIMIGYGARYKEFIDLRLAAALRRADEAERAEQEKLTVLAMIAHELGNPLTVAMGNMRIASRFLEMDDVRNLRDLIGDSREALDRLAGLTKQIVSASRNESPRMELEIHPLLPIVKKAADWTRKTAEDKGISFEERVCEDYILVDCSPDDLLSVFTNLMSNAVRYTPAGGTITVHCQAHEDHARVSVTDTGIGIKEEDRQHIFDRFYRGAEGREMARGGLGMGLNIARGIVEAHHGRIELDSEPGKGSTFTVYLPLVREAPE